MKFGIQSTFIDRLIKIGQFRLEKLSRSTFLLAFLASCGGNNQTTDKNDNGLSTNITPNPTSPTPLPPTENTILVEANIPSVGFAGVKDVISATSESLTTKSTIIDDSPYDNDSLKITVSSDMTDLPIVSGIEHITFMTNSLSMGDDNELDIDLDNISSFEKIYFENSNDKSIVNSLSLTNAFSKLSVGSNFPTIKIGAKPDKNIELELSSDTNLSTTGLGKNLEIRANGSDVTLTSSSATGNISINYADTVNVVSASAKGNIDITANGNVSLHSISSLKGNISVTSVGTISIFDASNAQGKMTLNNERASAGSDITITNAKSVGNATITSSGSITATQNGGLASAKIIIATMEEDSTIFADGVSNQKITLHSENSNGNTTNVNLNASTLENLTLGGSSPLVVTLDAADISTETVLNTNSDSTLWLIGGTTDLTNVVTSVQLRLKNFDGSTVTVKDSQDFYLDAEIAQTASTAIPTFDHQTDATGSTTNAVTLKTFDSNTSNGDKTVNIAGLNFVDVQTLNLNLLNDLNLESSSDITGVDLTSVVITGTGDFDLNTNTITGDSSTRVALNASNLSGSATLNLDATSNGVANIQTGSAADNIKIDGITTDTAGFVIASNGSNDTIRITANGDGSSAKININAGGGGSDTLALDAGVDLSSSNLTLTSVERILLTGGGTTQKIAASDVSGVSLKLAENGTGTATFTVVADQTTINLSNFTFETSFAVGTDTVVVNASSSGSGVTVTGSSGTNTITGSNANDSLTGGASADNISGGTGDDTINGGTGADILTGGAGDDEFDFASGTSTEASMDKITDYQAAVAENHNDKIDLITGAKGANSTSIDVKSAIAGGGGSETVTASVTNGVATLSGTDKALINTLAEWIDAVSVDGVIKKAADDADAIGVVVFELSGNTYLVESNDTFDNNTANVSIVTVIELEGLTGVTAVADAAAANTILIA